MLHALADRSGCNDADQSAGSSPWTKGVRHGGVRTRDVISVPRRASEGIQELGAVRQFSLSCGLFRAELGGTEKVERIGQRLQNIRKNGGAGLDVDRLQQQFQVQNGRRGPFRCPNYSEALESVTSGEGFRRGDAGPTLAGSICTRQRESASVAFRVQAATGSRPPISTDQEDVVGESCLLPLPLASERLVMRKRKCEME